jgi:hypothetical protein
MTAHDTTTLDIHESGWTITLIVLVFSLIPLVVSAGQSLVIPAIVVTFLVGIALVFRSLRVVVREGRLRVRIGGLITVEDVAVRDIVAVERTRFSALAGLGIRWTSRGTLYAVNFGEAVEIRLRSGTSFFLNMNDPDALIVPMRDVIGAP